MAVPFSSSKAVKGCSTGFATVVSHDLFPIKMSAECRKAGTAPKQYEQKWYLLLFHIRVIREAGRLKLVVRKCMELKRVVGRSLPCYPVIPLRSCDRAALIYHDQLYPKQRSHDIHKTGLCTPLHAAVVPPTEKSSSLSLPPTDLEI